MKKFKPLLPIAAIIIAGIACDSTQIDQGSDNPPLDTAVAATVTALAPMPIDSLAADLACPIETADPDPPELSGIETFPSQVQTYLNQGGSIQVLLQAMQANHLAPLEGITISQQDFTDDGYKDVAVSAVGGNGQSIAPSGTLLLFVCQDGQYQLNYTSVPSVELGAPIIRAAQDLNGDGVFDLLLSRESCGAHTCFFEVSVLIWDGETLINIFSGVTSDMPTPTMALDGPQDDGSYDIIVTANGIGSVGAGPFRLYSRIWSYDQQSGQYFLADSYQHESNFRIHILYDADQAVLDDDFDSALSLYARVIDDASLDDWLSDEEESRTLAAYAMYRRVLTFLQLVELDSAQAEYARLQSSFPPDTPNHAYVELAQSLWDEFQANGLAAACQAARAYAQTHTQTILDPLYFGYANKTFVAADICPIEN